MLLLVWIALAPCLAFAQEPGAPGQFADSDPVIQEAAGAQVEVERLTNEVRRAMSARRWSAAVSAADELLAIDPGNSTARVMKEQAEHEIQRGTPEGIPTPTPSPTPAPTPEIEEVAQAGLIADPSPSPGPIPTGGETPVELILAAVAAAIFLLVVVWFFFFARKKPAERRTPSSPVAPVRAMPISPYSKAASSEPSKDENLIQYGSVGQLNKKAAEGAAPAAAAVAAAGSVAKSTRPMEEPPTVRESPLGKSPEVKAVSTPTPSYDPIAAGPTSTSSEDSTHEESTHEGHDESHDAIAVTEPINPVTDGREVRPTLSEPVARELAILKVDLDSIEIAPAAPPTSGEAGPDDASLPRIKLSDAPITEPATVESEEAVVGADLPSITFDESLPLELAGPTGGEAALAAIADAALPSIKMSEEEFHFGGADEVGLNDLPDLVGDMGDPAEALPTLKLSDTPLEELEKMVNGGRKEEANAGAGGGDGMKSIKMVEG